MEQDAVVPRMVDAELAVRAAAGEQRLGRVGARGRGSRRRGAELPERLLKGATARCSASGLPAIVQYWRSFDHLEAFARDATDPHLAVWRNYWRRVGNSARTGIWHETYLVRAGEYEAVYGNMPPFGLGKAGRLVPMSESSSARLRLKKTVADPATPTT
jgi:hypothetical protein